MSLVRRPRSGAPPGNGLQPLPQAKKWPEGTPLDPAVAEAALWHAAGNVTKAAKLMGTDSARLGYMISKTSDLQDTRRRASELVLDRAEAALIDSLKDDDSALDTAKWILSNGGRGRGWGREATQGLGFAFDGMTGSGQVAIRWEVAEKPDA